MSIIYEALKKVEANFRGFDGTTKEVKVTRKNKRLSFKLYFIYLFAIGVGFFTARFFYQSSAVPALKTQPTVMEPVAQPAIPLPQPEAIMDKPLEAEKAELPKEKPVELILNGTFFSGKEGYALINNQIVKEGDRVAGMIVMRISKNEVELKNKDSTLKLLTNPR